MSNNIMQHVRIMFNKAMLHSNDTVYYNPPQNREVIQVVNKKTPLESIEDCELLRFLELGHEIKMIKMSDKSISVDTKKNLTEVIKKINNS